MIAGMLIAFGIAIVCFSLGHGTGYLMGVKVRNVSALFAAPVETRKCICSHKITSHTLLAKGAQGSCQTALSEDGKSVCACQGYVAAPDVREKGLFKL